MSDDEIGFIREKIGRTRWRVKSMRLPDGRRVVAKKQRPARSAWRGRFVDALAAVIGLPLLRAAPAPGGAAAQAIEVQRLRALAAAGLRVPALLHVAPDFIVIEHLDGHNLAERIGRGGGDGFAAWQRGLAALVDVHRRAACLSLAFARNFVDAEDGVAMIDFEDDPEAVMPLADAQARDWLAYLHSTVWLLDADPARARDAAEAALAMEAAPVRERVAAASRRLAPLRLLPRSRRPFGREVVGLQAMAAIFPLSSRGAAAS